jgi:hypothetical protein
MITTSISRARTFILANADEIAKHDMEFAILISDDMADKRVERGSVVLLAECGDNRLRILFKEHGMDFVFSKKGSLVNTENSIETVSGYTDAAYNEVSLLFGQSVNRFQQPSNVRRIGIGVK